jgi:hypothetical protein
MRNPGTAAVLSLLIPGVGQFYNGDFLRGVFWLIVTPGLRLGRDARLDLPRHRRDHRPPKGAVPQCARRCLDGGCEVNAATVQGPSSSLVPPLARDRIAA